MTTVSRETKLAIYQDLLLRWSNSLNLSSRQDSDPGGFRSHIADSAFMVPHLPPNLSRLVDLGSGQGFPAIPLAILTGIAVDMIEADKRKAAFLITVMAKLNLPGTVLASRIEATSLPKAACVTARALAPISRLLILARPFLEPTGCCLLLKGPNWRREVDEAAPTETFTHEVFPTASARSNLVKITNLR